jgi:hypothetical protein
MEAVRLKSSVGIESPPSRSTLGIPGIVDIGAKPKKAWFDFWLTSLYSVLPVGFDLSVAMWHYPNLAIHV